MKKHVLVLSILLALSACGTTEQVVLETLEPSPVALPNVIKKIGIVDGSTASRDYKIENRVDQYLAAESRWLSEKGTDAALTGLFDELLKDRRFDAVKLLDSIPADMKGFISSDDTISWSTLEALCQAHDVDAIFSLAYYDTETKVSLKKTSVMQYDLLRRKKKVKGQEITLETLIENGWKIYDPFNRQVIDQIVFNDQFVSTGKGVDPLQAYQSIDDRRETIITKSKSTGSNYGLRLLPYENHVIRSYYAKGTEKFVKANELVVSGDWQAAGELWKQETENPDTKIRARGCHNLAVLNERDDDLEKALSWVNKAQEQHKDKVILEYRVILEDRIAQRSLLERQLTELEFAK